MGERQLCVAVAPCLASLGHITDTYQASAYAFAQIPRYGRHFRYPPAVIHNHGEKGFGGLRWGVRFFFLGWNMQKYLL